MILCVAPNPSIDKLFEVERLERQDLVTDDAGERFRLEYLQL